MEVLSAVFEIYKSSKDEDSVNKPDESCTDILDQALKTLDQEYLSSDDPNLRSLGLQLVDTKVPKSTIRNKLGEKLFKMVKTETDTGL